MIIIKKNVLLHHFLRIVLVYLRIYVCPNCNATGKKIGITNFRKKLDD